LGPAPLGRNYAEWLEKKRPGAYEEIYRERRGQASYNKIGVMDIPLNEDEYVENWISEQSVNFINKGAKSEKPFFLWCGFCGPHGPFDPPEPYRGMYNPEDVELPPETEGFPSWRDICDEKLMRQCIAYYQAMVTCIDFHVGKIINELKRLGIYDNTMIIYVSDHGEMLGEKGLMGKCVFYEPVTRVPMWIRPPAGSVFKKGNFDGLTEAMDIAPTILDYAGIEIPGKMTAKSLRPVIQDRANTGHNMIFSEYVDNNKNEMSKCVRTSEYKYIRFFKSGKEELYNITRDPLEQNNLVEVQKEKKEELKDMMFSRIALTETIRNYG
jgi:arylsulfatase A-like enzyme